MSVLPFAKVLWMVITINGDVAGVLHDEPMPDYMTMEDCEISAAQQERLPENRRKGAKFHCYYHHRKPFNTGRFSRRLE